MRQATRSSIQSSKDHVDRCPLQPVPADFLDSEPVSYGLFPDQGPSNRRCNTRNRSHSCPCNVKMTTPEILKKWKNRLIISQSGGLVAFFLWRKSWEGLMF